MLRSFSSQLLVVLVYQFEDGLDKFVDQARDVYLPVSFVIGSSTYGLKTSLDNFVFQSDVSLTCTGPLSGMTSTRVWVCCCSHQSTPFSVCVCVCLCARAHMNLPLMVKVLISCPRFTGLATKLLHYFSFCACSRWASLGVH